MVRLIRFFVAKIVFIGVMWSLYFIIGLICLYLITITEPATYIDEIFHAGQCQRYCRGNFHYYDPKLTTPPGLYVITVMVLYPLSKLFQTDLCNLSTFRLFNFLVSHLNCILLYKIVNSQAPKIGSVKVCLISLCLSSFPLLYFFSFFYYTDVVSTFCILLTFHLYNRNRSFSAGIVGLVSVTIRQTNLIWFCYFAFLKCCKFVDMEASKTGRSISKAEKRKMSYILVIVKGSLHLMKYSFRSFLMNILRDTFFLIISTLLFSYFLLKNGSIVLGDKSAHEAVIHVPQLLYFSLFTFIMAFPCHIFLSVSFIKNLNRRKFTIIFSVFVISLVVAVNSMAHIYLISDNRHYTFYIWKRIFERRFGRYLLIPLYVISMYNIKENVSHLDSCTKLGFLASSVICLIPQKLLEFRYFIIPYLLYRIKTCHKLTRWQLIMELFFNSLINYSTVALFLYKPFQWPDGTIQRFSW